MLEYLKLIGEASRQLTQVTTILEAEAVPIVIVLDQELEKVVEEQLGLFGLEIQDLSPVQM